MTTESLATSDQSSDHEYVKHMLHFVGRAGIAATVPGMHAYAKAHVRRPTGAAPAKQPEEIPADLECFFFVAIEHSLEIAVEELVAKKAKPIGATPAARAADWLARFFTVLFKHLDSHRTTIRLLGDVVLVTLPLYEERFNDLREAYGVALSGDPTHRNYVLNALVHAKDIEAPSDPQFARQILQAAWPYFVGLFTVWYTDRSGKSEQLMEHWIHETSWLLGAFLLSGAYTRGDRLGEFVRDEGHMKVNRLRQLLAPWPTDVMWKLVGPELKSLLDGWQLPK